MSAISRKVRELGAAIGLLAIGFQGCSANDELTGGSEEQVATTAEAIAQDIHYCARYEAEAMTRIGLTGTTSGGITLFANTSALEKVHSFDPGPQLHGIIVYARGTPAGGIWPKMRLRVNNVIQGWVDQVTVDTSTYAPYGFYFINGPNIANLPIKIEYTNDGIVNGVDRNLHIDGIYLTCPLGVRCGTGWCDTNGTGNVCCVNQNGTSPVCQSAANCSPSKVQISCDNHSDCPKSGFEPAWQNLCSQVTTSLVACNGGHPFGSGGELCTWPGCVCKSPGMLQEAACPNESPFIWPCQNSIPSYGGGWKTCQVP